MLNIVAYVIRANIKTCNSLTKVDHLFMSSFTSTFRIFTSNFDYLSMLCCVTFLNTYPRQHDVLLHVFTHSTPIYVFGLYLDRSSYRRIHN